MAVIKRVAFIFWEIVLIFLFTPLFGAVYKFIYEDVFGGKIDGGVGISIYSFEHPEYFEGFFISLSFFITLALTIFGGKKKYQLLAVLLGLVLLVQVGVPESLIISAGAAVVSWFLAQVILLIKKKFVGKQ